MISNSNSNALPSRHSYSLVVVAIVLTAMFFVSGIDKVMHFTKVVGGFERRFPVAMPRLLNQLAIVAAILIEIVAPIALVFAAYDKANSKSRRMGMMAALALVVFTIAATLIYHFPPFGHQYYPFMSNLTSVGGLLLMAWVFRERTIDM